MKITGLVAAVLLAISIYSCNQYDNNKRYICTAMAQDVTNGDSLIIAESPILTRQDTQRWKDSVQYTPDFRFRYNFTATCVEDVPPCCQNRP